MDRPFIAENAKERERLKALAGRLTDEELSLTFENGWTVAAALAHLSFWDQRSFLLLKKWKSTGVESASVDIDVINDALLLQWLAIPPRTAAELAVSSAEAIDGELEEAASELVAEIENRGDKFRLYRSIHRKMHLDEIEALIDKKGAS